MYGFKRLTITAILFILGGITIVSYYNTSPYNKNEIILFTVPRGKSLSYIASKLEEKGLIKSQNFFKLISLIVKGDTNIKAGVYELNSRMTSYEILKTLISGKVKMIQFTIVEGWTNEQIANYFLEQGFIKEKQEFLNLTTNKDILKKYKIEGPSTEGFLFPETYTIDPELKIEKIHEIMLQMFYKKLNSITEKEIPPKKLYKKVIIASIIEREAIHKEELPIMASVYYNRLKKGMKLQADPTIQYILKNPKKKLTLKDLEIDSPYNTYKYKGLPPTPISNPGYEALKSAIFPLETEYYFFVLMEDGKHYFSKTYTEHLKAKKQYWDQQ